MAYNGKHLAKLDDLKALGTKQKEVADALAARVDTLENVGSQANVLEGVKVNGTALSIANKMVDILIATGSKNGSISVNGADVAIKGLAALAFKAKVSQSDLDEALAAILEGKADKATTLDGYGITNAYTKDEINAKISAVYKPAGAVAFAELPSLSESILGNVYNVTDAFTTTANFVEGAGNKCQMSTHSAGHYMDDYCIILPDIEDLKKLGRAIVRQFEIRGIPVNKKKCKIIPLTKPFRWCKARFTLTETGKIKVNGSRDGVIRARRKLKLFHREWLAGKRTLQEVAQYMNCQEAYYKNFDDHGRLLRLRRLCYAIFGGRVPCSTKSSKPVMAPSLP